MIFDCYKALPYNSKFSVNHQNAFRTTSHKNALNVALLHESHDQTVQSRQATPLHREEESGPAATTALSPQQKLVVTNEVHTLHRSHLLSQSSSYITTRCHQLIAVFNYYIFWQQRVSYSAIRRFLLSAKGVACETRPDLGTCSHQNVPDHFPCERVEFGHENRPTAKALRQR